jgi:hypothetical protein
MTWASVEEPPEFLDDLAADDPLRALREFPECLSDYRLDVCATIEPLAALTYAHDLVTPNRRRLCEAATQGLRFFPDRLERERRQRLTRRGRDWGQDGQ